MRNICDRNDCTGCEICASKCPRGAIEMQSDKLGFFYPSVAENKCVDCGICQRVCHISSPVSKNEYIQNSNIYAGWLNNDALRQKSTSGGAFSALAESVLIRHGYVVGAAYGDRMTVVHKVVSDEAELSQLRGSKYVQSRMNNILPRYRQAAFDRKYSSFFGNGVSGRGGEKIYRRQSSGTAHYS